MSRLDCGPSEVSQGQPSVAGKDENTPLGIPSRVSRHVMSCDEAEVPHVSHVFRHDAEIALAHHSTQNSLVA
jgi:hypothetical protein